jgi:hypothetical protein
MHTFFSTDAGKTFVNLLGFPHPDFCPKCANAEQRRTERLKHRIITIAFGQSGQYAFLTNQREVLFGVDDVDKKTYFQTLLFARIKRFPRFPFII